MIAHSIPVRLEFHAMRCQPFSHEPQCASRNRTGKHVARRDHDRRLITAVAGMEMRGA
jgi:hypothetical protein